MSWDMHQVVGHRNILWITLDTLRYDVAVAEFAAGRLPTLAALFPQGWQRRHSPASFTYAAHAAFFAGFLPTPATPGLHPRPLALRFAGSATTSPHTYVFDSADIVSGLAGVGYRTLCIGGVGFFRGDNPLSNQLPNLFQERYWEENFGVTCAESTAHQVAFACRQLAATSGPVFLFLNVSALHQPNHHYLPGSTGDSLASHAAALRYVDSQLAPLLAAIRRDRGAWVMVTSDHGTCYGEDGYHGHRLGHPQVWEVPYAEALLEPT